MDLLYSGWFVYFCCSNAEKARKFGAEGIGLFRVEHMFYGQNSEKPLFILRKMILAGNEEERKAAVNLLL